MKLRPVEYNPGEDSRRFEEFSTQMGRKWTQGRDDHGQEFKTDPIEEAQNECLDLANYMLVVYFRLQDLKERLKKIDDPEN